MPSYPHTTKRTSRGITEGQRRFAEEYVFGKLFKHLGDYAALFGVAVETISAWLRDERIRAYIAELREQRRELIQRHAGEQLVDTALAEIETVAKLDPQRIVNKGKRNEYRVYDPALIDRKLRAAEALVNFANGDDLRKADEIAQKVGGVTVQVNAQANASSSGKAEPTLAEIEELLRAKAVLSRNERLVSIEDLQREEAEAERKVIDVPAEKSDAEQ